MTTLTVSDRSPSDVKADALVLAAVRTDAGAALAPGAGWTAGRRRGGRRARSRSATGSADEVHRLPGVAGIAAPLVVLVGLGDGDRGRDGVRPGGPAPRGRCRDPALPGRPTGRARPARDDAGGRRPRSPRVRCSAPTVHPPPGRRHREVAPSRRSLVLARTAPRPAPPRGGQAGRGPGGRPSRSPATWSTPPRRALPRRAFADSAGPAAGSTVKVRCSTRRRSPGRLRRHPRRRPGLGPPAAAGEAHLQPARQHRGHAPRASSARASPSTPAASRSSPPRHGDDEVRHGRRRRGARRGAGDRRALGLQVNVTGWLAARREHAVRLGAPAPATC